ncbi:putative membrane protein [Yersinia enterocolitica subsp. enterocolitica 8081]|uniref:Membrane protein n=1 Tax=Yersinia enterocolitica serotype O:8 / biotype 1B (strain NCTC 13174 / 8081) TaxID=393305 RepID=A1JJ43_YERE8|nr:putative membrane protein [Yersinia enterocolitica subsp. enterocolitica 8081]
MIEMHWFAKDWEDYLWNKILIPKLSILMLTIPLVAGSRKEKERFWVWMNIIIKI